MKKVKIIIFIILLLIFGYSLYKISSFYLDVYKNNKTMNKIIEEVTKVEVNEDNEKEEILTIDFSSLLEINEDVKGWLFFNNISYPILQGKDNSYYLTHSIDKTKNSLGSIFMDYRNKDYEDRNIVIFGHNTVDGSMFGSLKEIFKDNYFDNNSRIIEIIDINNNKYRYEIFSYYAILKEEYYITTSFKSDEEYLKFLNTIKERSEKDFNVSLNADDKVLTFSTCNGSSGTSKRTVIHARVIKDE